MPTDGCLTVSLSDFGLARAGVDTVVPRALTDARLCKAAVQVPLLAHVPLPAQVPTTITFSNMLFRTRTLTIILHRYSRCPYHDSRYPDHHARNLPRFAHYVFIPRFFILFSSLLFSSRCPIALAHHTPSSY